MTVLDEFYIVIKTNTEDVKKGLTEVEKKTGETEKALKRQSDEVNNLGKSFVKMVEGGAALAGAWAGAGIIKNAVVAQTDYNRELENTSILTKSTIGDLSRMAQMAALASGNKEDRAASLQDMKAMAALAHSMNISSYKPQDQMNAIRQRYQSMANSPAAQQSLLDLFSTEGMKLLVAKNPDEYSDILSKSKKAIVSDETGKNALAAGQAQVDLAGSEAHLENTISDWLIPALNRVTDAANAVVNAAGGNILSSLGLGGLFVAVKAGWAAIKGRAVVKALGLGGSSGDGGAGKAAVDMTEAESLAVMRAGIKRSAIWAARIAAADFVGVGAGSLAVGGTIGYYGLGAFSGPIENMLAKRMSSDLYVPPQGALTNSMKQGGNDPIIKFFMGKGYSKSQAAGIAANIYKESGGNASARGDGGHAYGLAQWHPDRAKAIKDGTGIDIYHATRDQQLEAIAWEMNGHRKQFNNGKFKGMGDAYSAGSYFSREFESPAASDKEAMARGNAAMALAAKYGNTTVNVGDVNIATQATNADDIAKHIKAGIIGACKTAQTNFDTGRMG